MKSTWDVKTNIHHVCEHSPIHTHPCASIWCKKGKNQNKIEIFFTKQVANAKCTQCRRNQGKNINNNQPAECFIHFSDGTNCKINCISLRCFFLVLFFVLSCRAVIRSFLFHSIGCCRSPRFRFICFFVSVSAPFFHFSFHLSLSFSLLPIPFQWPPPSLRREYIISTFHFSFSIFLSHSLSTTSNFFLLHTNCLESVPMYRQKNDE